MRQQDAEQIQHAIRHGLTAAVQVRLNDPTYGAPTRSRLTTPEARTAVKACVSSAFRDFLQKEASALAFFTARIARDD
ncbi:MAG TPA: hypothetical protein VFQ61_16395 [Polyangiaceae bacterium]|nr:hypothetical protein [Polyangiaceae bacterium]